MNNQLTYNRYQNIIEDWNSFEEYLRKPLPKCIWLNSFRNDSKIIVNSLESKGIKLKKISWTDSAFRIEEGDSNFYFEYVTGQVHIQEEVSMLPVKFLDIQPDDFVLDMCSAPGNKTAQISTSLGDAGCIVANDKDFSRMRALKDTIERMSLTNVVSVVQDGTIFPEFSQFDKVLVDAPCSCEGTSRKKSRVLKPKKTVDYYLKFNNLQKKLLKKAISLTKVGGTIVYSTCTYAPEENEMVVDQVLKHFGTDKIELKKIDIPNYNYSRGITNWDGKIFDKSLENSIRIYPHQNNTGGFFICVIKKIGEVNNSIGEVFKQNKKFNLFSDLQKIDYVKERFSLKDNDLERYTLLQPNPKEAYLTSISPSILDKVKFLPFDAIGLRFLHYNMRFPKPTIPAIMLLGNRIQQNFILVNREQAKSFLLCEDFVIDDDQLDNITGFGYVVIVYKKIYLGIANYKLIENEKAAVSMYKKLSDNKNSKKLTQIL